MKYQLLSVNFFQSKTYLFTGWLVEHHTFGLLFSTDWGQHFLQVY
jgi:hypothetical protein